MSDMLLWRLICINLLFTSRPLLTASDLTASADLLVIVYVTTVIIKTKLNIILNLTECIIRRLLEINFPQFIHHLGCILV